jgi:HK97 family phage prohead protease
MSDDRLNETGRLMRVCGYASVFNVKDEQGDIVLPGAFRQSLISRPVGRVSMRREHKSEGVLGRWLTIREDDFGLWVEGEVLDPPSDMPRGLSIGYRTIKSKLHRLTGTRRLIEVDLWEVSLVRFPSLAQAVLQEMRHAA